MFICFFFLGPYGYDDGNSTSSVHNSPHCEAVNSAIMEVSGELLLGKFTPQKQQSGGSESSDISDDDARRAVSRGSIAKYPESSTGLSDNDWNPYATESDTNQTPRSPRSNNSDDQNRVGYVSKATFNIGGTDKSKPTTATVSMKSGEISLGDRNENRAQSKNGSERLDILRFVMNDDKLGNTGSTRLSQDSATDTVVRGSTDSRNFGTETSDSGTLSGQPSIDYDRDILVRESVDSARSDGTGAQSGRQSVESGRSSRSDMSGESGRQSLDTDRSQKSGQSRTSAQSKHSQKSTDRSDRLDQFNEAAGGNIKELIDFESAQRYKGEDSTDKDTDGDDAEKFPQVDNNEEPVARTRLSARLESYSSPVRSDKSPERSPTIIRNAGGYISVAEREKLLSDSPEFVKLLPKSTTEERKKPKPVVPSSYTTEVPRSQLDGDVYQRIPTTVLDSDMSMKRVSSLFEETKRQAREAVALRRPEPSGSEERFPLRERLTVSKHDDSFKVQDKSSGSEGRLEKSRESEAARSLNSEEVARVLGSYHEDQRSEPQKKRDNANFIPASSHLSQDVRKPAVYSDEESEELSRRVQALLSRAESYAGYKESSTKPQGKAEYVPHTIDYSRLQQDLQEIQDSLHDAPPATANDSLYLRGRERVEQHDPRREREEQTERSTKDDYATSLEVSRTTYGGRDSAISEYGRESGISEYGKKLVWDHGADLQYEKGFGGEFIGKSMSRTSSKLRDNEETLTRRPDSATTDDTDADLTEISRPIQHVSQSDLTRAERIVDQVMSRRAEGDLKESVEDIIARYRNERKDLFDRHQAPLKQQVIQDTNIDELQRRNTESTKATLKDPSITLSVLTPTGDASQPINGKKQPGLAERVYKILTAEDTEESDNPEDKGMAKKVYKILASDRPEDQVNGILADTMAEENEALKLLVNKPKEDSSLDDSAINVTTESYDLGDQDVNRQLNYSLFSSPGKGERSELAALREVTSAPYSALSNAKSLLSSQLQKMSKRNFDKSVELRTPYRQTIECYPVYGVDRRAASERGQIEPREAWMPENRPTLTQTIEERNKDFRK